MHRFYACILLLLATCSMSSGLVMYLRTTHARREVIVQYSRTENQPETTILKLSGNEFTALEKERISEKIFEIQWKGERYDIIDLQYQQNGDVYLTAHHDKKEAKAIKDFADAHQDGANAGNLIFFSFCDGIIHTDIIHFIPSEIFLHSEYNVSLHRHSISPTSPPPDFLAA